MAATLRFSVLLASSGTPRSYLPLMDPKRDKEFMRAVAEQRVVTLKQEPTGNKKDYGTVGFLEEKHVSYLIFPKALPGLAGKKVVGIDYSKFETAPLSVPAVPPVAPKRKRKFVPKLVPEPQSFRARVRVSVTAEVDVTVYALDEEEARRKAVLAAREQAELGEGKIQTAVLSLRKRT